LKVEIKAKTINTNVTAEVANIDVHYDDAVRRPPRAVRVLFLAANPLETTRLRLDEEVRSIDEAIQRAAFRERFALISQWAVRETDLQRHLLRYEPDIVHFAGHGEAGGELVLEDAAGRTAPAPPELLQALFRRIAGRARCVVINACFSQRQARALAEDIPCVVGMSRAIADAAAIRFATAFYEALGYGRDIKTAFELARQQVKAAYDTQLRHAQAQSSAEAESRRDGSEIPVLLGSANPADITFVSPSGAPDLEVRRDK
jgi:hypothetical protein